MIRTPFEVTRQVLPHVLNLRGLTGQGVEVGVCRGEFSDVILAQWPGTLYLVDPWSPLDDYKETYDHEQNYKECTERLSKYQGRAVFVRQTSLDATQFFDDGSLDFVYLDANHEYESVLKDMEAWYPKVKKGGILAGDDYGAMPEQQIDFGNGIHYFGVKRAVDEFCVKHQKNASIDWEAQWTVTDGKGSEWLARNWWMCA
jgi:Methyltransferase domain